MRTFAALHRWITVALADLPPKPAMAAEASQSAGSVQAAAEEHGRRARGKAPLPPNS